MNDRERSQWWRDFSEKVVETFGKNTFSEEELTEDFYTDLYISCGDYFRTEDGYINLDWFWHEELREWLLTEK